MCMKGSLVLVLVLDWTQCLPQGVGAPPAMQFEVVRLEEDAEFRLFVADAIGVH